MLPCDSVLCSHCASTRSVLTSGQLISANFLATTHRSHKNLDKAGGRVSPFQRPSNDRILWRPVLLAPHGNVVEKSEVSMSLFFPHADTHCLLGRPSGVENPGTLPLICFQHPSANKNSDLDVASDDNTALRKSERTLGTATIRRTNWLGIPRLDDFISRLHRGRRCVSIEGGLRPVVTRAFACSISRNSVAHRPSLLPHGRARTSDRAQSPIASQRVVGITDNTEYMDQPAHVRT